MIFQMLTDRHLPMFIFRFLLNLYSGYLVCIAWEGIVSDFCHVINGVQLGGVICPVLSFIYIDGLLFHLKKSIR